MRRKKSLRYTSETFSSFLIRVCSILIIPFSFLFLPFLFEEQWLMLRDRVIGSSVVESRPVAAALQLQLYDSSRK